MSFDCIQCKGNAMIAVLVNCFTIILGSLLGIIFSKKITSRLSEVIQTGAGVVVLVLGVEMTLQYDNILFLTFSLMAGGIIGSIIDIDGKIFKIGQWLGTKLPQKEEKSTSSFGYGFLNASVLFCVGAMSIVGSIEAGVNGNYSVIFTKSLLDGFMAIVFASSMGVGVVFSFLTVLIYQGALTLLATVIASYMDEVLLAELTASGGALIIMIAINLLGLKSIKTANYLPAVFLCVLFVLLERLLF
ncbi:MAG: DUF554 domain-containing protein [Candidatus Treponema excrementipullorum]|nr:DUF554 domain-containing protein [Candidatus Treponema excrementipullorum]